MTYILYGKQLLYLLNHFRIKMKTLLVAIAKNENKYIDEFINYHYKLGFSQIVICDNNDIDGEVISNDKVIVEDFRGKHKERKLGTRYFGIQEDAYNYCYKKYNEQYDWIAFLDIDEFLTIPNDTLEGYLKTVDKNASAVYVNWIIYGDNEKLYYEDKPVLERFPNQSSNLSKPENPKGQEYFKTIVRGHGECKHMYVHNCKVKHYVVNSNNERIFNHKYMPLFIDKCVDKIYIRHYITKSISEYLERHFHKTSATGIEYFHNTEHTCYIRFFNINEWTQEKQNIFDNYVKNCKYTINEHKWWIIRDKMSIKLKYYVAKLYRMIFNTTNHFLKTKEFKIIK